jgi:hypothetical protein
MYHLSIHPSTPKSTTPHSYLTAAFRRQSRRHDAPDGSPDNDGPSSLPPHIYGTAAAAYRGLVREGGRDQSILVSGEASLCLWIFCFCFLLFFCDVLGRRVFGFDVCVCVCVCVYYMYVVRVFVRVDLRV